MNRSSYKYTALAFITYNNARICVRCYSVENICVHHKDENYMNNKEDNLQILCKSCHTSLHTKWKVSWNKWKKMSKKFIDKMKISNKGVNNGFYWKKHTEETKAKMRKAKKKA
jgi:hypothetical protein